MEYFAIQRKGGSAPSASIVFAFVALEILHDENRSVGHGSSGIGAIPAFIEFRFDPHGKRESDNQKTGR